MSVTISQFLFFLAFLSLFFLLSVFGETPAQFLIIGLITSLLLIFKNQTQFQDVRTNKNLMFFLSGWIAWLAIVIGSLFTTVSVPLTLNKVFFWLFSFVCLSFFSTVDKKWLSWNFLKIGLLSSGFVLSILSLFTSLIPVLRAHLPGQNLLVANYGHNHISAIILLLLPICWESWESKKYKKLTTFLLFFFNFVLLVSFGRIAVFLGFIEMAILFWKRNAFLTKRMRFAFTGLGGLFLVATIVLSISPITSLFQEDATCLSPQLKVQLCKSFRAEPRPAYWEEAVKGFAARPLTGWGGGTFNTVSLIYTEHPFQISTHSHNEYLEQFSNFGVVGGLFFLAACLWVLSKLVTVIRAGHLKTSPAFFIALGLTALFIDNFFDYDWEFYGIWLLFLIGLAYFFHEFNLQKENHIHSKKLDRRVKFISLSNNLSILAVLTFSTLYLISQFFWSTHEYDRSLNIFPLVYWQVQDKIGTNYISKVTTKKLEKMYEYDANMLVPLSNNLMSLPEKQVVLEKLVSLNREKFIFDLLENYVSQNKWQEFATEVSTVNQTHRSEYLSDEEVKQLAAYSLTGADTALKEKKFVLTQELYEHAYRLNPAVFTDQHALLLSNLQLFSLFMNARFVDKWELKYLGKYWQSVEDWYRVRLSQATLAQDDPEVALTTQRLLEFSPDSLNYVCTILTSSDYFDHLEQVSDRIISPVECQR